jgi:hypothetical protein
MGRHWMISEEKGHLSTCRVRDFCEKKVGVESRGGGFSQFLSAPHPETLPSEANLDMRPH